VPAQAPRRILIVDDDVESRESLALVLTLDGHRVACAADGAQALERARAGADLVLIDLGLPDFDGRELATRLRAEGCTARLVALSGTAIDPADTIFDAHLLKPLRPEALGEFLA